MFVRTKVIHDKERGKTRRYRQLVENYWDREAGRPRQRVLAHLGKHETPEDALEDLRKKLADLEGSKLYKQVWEYRATAARWEKSMRRKYGAVLDRYWDGRTPSEVEHKERAYDTSAYSAPRTDEIVGKDYFGEPIYAYMEVDVPDEVEEYRRAFGDVKREDKVTPWGTRFHYSGLFWFGRDLQSCHIWRALHSGKREEYNQRRQRLTERIQKLESIVHSD